MTPEDTKNRLMARHPWHDAMSAVHEWPKLRAVAGGWNDPKVKTSFLVKGEIEKDRTFATRVELTQPTGTVEQLIQRTLGAVFREKAKVEYNDDELQTWSEDVDGQGTPFLDWLERKAEEALTTGIVGILIDKDPDGMERGAAAPSSRAAEDLAGLSTDTFLTAWMAEEIVNWGVDKDGDPTFVVLQRTITDQVDFKSVRSPMVEWIVMDRETVTVYRATIKGQSSELTGALDSNGLPMVKTGENIEDPYIHIDAQPHGLSHVPFEPLYGIEIGPMRGRSPFRSAARADVATLNEDSAATMARYVHNVPAFWVKTDQDMDDVIKEGQTAFKLRAMDGEEIGYATTPSESFEVGMKAVEAKRLESYRQAGSAPSGMFDGGSQAESGRSRQVRFAQEESRGLSRFSTRLREAAESVLEVVARRMGKPDGFTGSVQFPKSFDLADTDSVIDHLNELDPVLQSPTWRREMHKRAALLSVGDVSAVARQDIIDEVDAASERVLVDVGEIDE